MAWLGCTPTDPPPPEAIRLDSMTARVRTALQEGASLPAEWITQYFELGESYCAQHADSVRCPRFYYVTAFWVFHRHQDPQLAVKYLHRIITEYPTVKGAPNALWQKALIYEAIGNLQGARSAYKSLIARYPTDSLAPLARQAVHLIDSVQSAQNIVSSKGQTESDGTP